jgi:tRNA dimethylallyltransferase
VSNKTLLCILGPTAVGKTAAAIRLAQQLHTEILSLDSRQFYKEISIGTAKPNEAELAAVPHHFINTISICDTYNAGDFERDALAKLTELFEQHDTVIAVGGSGLYVKALIEGLDDLPKADENLREELNQLYATKGISVLQERLAATDPALFAQTEMKNPQRIMRAIEVAEAMQKGFVPAFSKQTRNFRTICVVLDLPREQLYANINKRVEMMMDEGLLEEVKRMIPYKNNYALQTVGYSELFDFFEGKHSLEKAIELIQQHTRNFAKRQLTWFRKEAPEHWFAPTDDEKILELLNH